MIRKIVVVLGAVGLAIFFVAGIAIMGSLRPEVEKMEPQTPSPIAFVKEIRYGTMPLVVSSQGEVNPRREIQLTAQVAGRIDSVSRAFANGGVIQKGEVLVSIEGADFELAVTRAQAAVAQAEQQLAVEEAEASLAARDYEELSGKSAQEDPSLLALRKPQLAAARAELASARANLADARLNLERTEIRAPFDGRVRSINANAGQYVSPGFNLGQIFSIDVAEIRLPLTDDDLGKLGLPFAFEATDDEGPRVVLSARVAGKDREWTGHIRRIDAAIDSSTRQIAAIAEVEDPYGEGADEGFPLAFGLYVDADIEGPVIENAALIPRLSLREDGTVYVVNEQDELAVRTPTVIAQVGDGVLISDGIEDGARLVVSPVGAAVGRKVRPLYENGASASRLPEPAEESETAAAAAAAGDRAGANL